jgi:hypothetical protein
VELHSLLALELASGRGSNARKNGLVLTTLSRPAVFFYWSEVKSLGLAMDEHGEHQDLRGSNRWSVIPYIYGRMRVVLFKR